MIDTNDFYITQIFIGFIYGILVGLLEEFTSHRRYITVSLPLQFLIKVLGMVLIITIMLASLIFIHPGVEFEDIRAFVRQKEVSSPLILAIIVAFTVITYFQIEKLIGKNMLSNYLKGKYRKPKKEIRVFLFLDLKSSTTISEKLGNDTYYSFLNNKL